jgi:sestrin
MKHTNKLIERLKKQRELQISTSNNEDTRYGSVSSDTSLIVDFENVEEETFTDDSQDDNPPSPFTFSEEFFSSSATDPHTLAFNPSPTNEYFSRFLDPGVEIPYEDFDVKSSEYSVFKLGDYCWETQGVVMVNDYLPNIDDSLGIGEVLDREFSEIRDLTDYRLFQYSSNVDLDTKPLRQAVWFYVLRLSGLKKDDYDYRGLNKFLNTKIKKFLKKVCCKPEEIEYKDWRNIGFYLREEEKCHVNLIAVEARKQAELVYGLSSVMKWENER